MQIEFKSFPAVNTGTVKLLFNIFFNHFVISPVAGHISTLWLFLLSTVCLVPVCIDDMNHSNSKGKTLDKIKLLLIFPANLNILPLQKQSKAPAHLRTERNPQQVRNGRQLPRHQTLWRERSAMERRRKWTGYWAPSRASRPARPPHMPPANLPARSPARAGRKGNGSERVKWHTGWFGG